MIYFLHCALYVFYEANKEDYFYYVIEQDLSIKIMNNKLVSELAIKKRIWGILNST